MRYQIVTILLFLGWVTLFESCRAGHTTPTAVINEQTSLIDYVNRPDPAFKYEKVRTIAGDGYDLHVLKLTSQKWLTSDEVVDPIWWHWLSIVVPHTVKTDIGMLWIGSGSRNAEAPEKAGQLLVHTALSTGSIAAEIHNIPNQPITFKQDTFGPRKEDELIAYGWRRYMDGGAKKEDAEWLARLPMTKAVVRAMDVVTEYCADSLNQPVTKYTVSGASKRGWTTWTTAIVDDRVIAIVPVVIDMLNLIPSFQHHWQAYGFWAPAVQNYEREGIMGRQQTPEYQQLVHLVDPFAYRSKLTLPKLLINASSDQFFLPDSWQFYWDQLEGEKHLRYVANTGHSLRGTDAISSLVAFHHQIVEDQARPTFDWSVEDDQLTVQTTGSSAPDSIYLWHVSNTEHRDFRIETIGPSWIKDIIPITSDGKYSFARNQPDRGWTAMYAELVFNSDFMVPLKFTTGIVVTPDDLPFPPHED